MILLISGVFASARAQALTATIDRDLRVFAVVAALNAAGFDVDLGPEYHPVRQAVRERVAGIDPDLLARLRQYYERERGDESDADQLAKYVSLALALTDPPGMQFMMREELRPTDAREIGDFVPLLDEFYREARISVLWSSLASDYDEAFAAMVPALREAIVGSDAFLRLPLGDLASRRLVILLELAAPVGSVNVRNYRDNLYVLLGYPASAPVGIVRSAYLHLKLGPIIAATRPRFRQWSTMLDWIQEVDGVQREFASDFEILVTESLIRAVELRLTTDSERSDSELIEEAYRQGLLLTPFFSEKFDDFLGSGRGMREYFPDLLAAIDVDRERQRFDERFHEISLSESVPTILQVPLPPDPVRPILLEAQDAMNSGDDEAARTAFERVIDGFDQTNGPALYGLGLLASREEDADRALEYFRRAVESSSVEPSMRIWAHVYLGRIYDIQCDREAALAEYRSALGSGDDTETALAAATAGLEGPFGGGCN